MLEINIPNEIFEQMLEQAGAEAPIEACGILAGRGRTVERIYRMTNIEAREDHYMMEPAEQLAAVKDMRAAGLNMLAIYHSHPATAARPSAEDIRLAFTPDITYVIRACCVEFKFSIYNAIHITYSIASEREL